ncbi:MAG: ParA family protein [Haloferacaceae archaeon]
MNDTLRVAAFIDKGGTGKTTATAHLGVALAEEGLDVLLIDLAGKQGDLAKTFGVWDDYRDLINTGDAWPNVTTVFQDEWEAIADKLGEDAVDDLVVAAGEGVDLIPAHPGLDSLDADLGNIDDAADRYSRLETFLDDYVDPRGYDALLLDLPGLTNNVSYSGLWAAKHVLAPVEMGPFEAEQADQLREDLGQMVAAFDVEVVLSMVLPNKVDTRTKLAEEYLEAFQDEYPDAIAPEYVPYSQDIRNAVDGGRTAFALEEPSGTARQAREAFATNARALIDRIGGA